MDILFIAITAGMAVSFVTELLSNVAGSVISPRLIKLVLNLPLSLMACWFLDLQSFELVVGGLAAAFISLALLQLLNRPVTIQTLNTRR